MLDEQAYSALKLKFQTVEESLTLSDMETILEDNGFHIMSRDGNVFRLNSACHNIDGGKANLAFYVDTKTFFCYSECNCSYNIYSLLVTRWKLLGRDCRPIDVLKYICGVKGIDFSFEASNNPVNTPIYDWRKNIQKYITKAVSADLKPYSKSVLKKFQRRYHRDWLDYGISEETMDKYNIMYYPWRDQIVIPVNDGAGNLVGIRGRNLDPKSNCKYIPVTDLSGTTYKFPIGSFFYGQNVNEAEIRRTKRADIVEAEKSVLKGDTWFREHNVTLGLMGSSLTKERIDYLIELGVEEVNLMLDSDFKDVNSEEFTKFEEKIFKMYDALAPYINSVYVVYNNLGYKDMYKSNCYDFDINRYNKLFANREKLS